MPLNGPAPEERAAFGRRGINAYFAAVQSRPGCKAISTDTCVPVRAWPTACLNRQDEAIEASGHPTFCGPCGDGNFSGYLLAPQHPRRTRHRRSLNHKLVAWPCPGR